MIGSASWCRRGKSRHTWRSWQGRREPRRTWSGIASGEMYPVGAGHVARFFVGRTDGYFNPALSIEDVRDHFEEIRDETGYTVPRDPGEETGRLFRTVSG